MAELQGEDKLDSDPVAVPEVKQEIANEVDSSISAQDSSGNPDHPTPAPQPEASTSETVPSQKQDDVPVEVAGGGNDAGGGGGGSDEEGDGEELDPRIEGELTKLNTGADKVNEYEKALDKAKEAFATEMKQVQANLAIYVKKCGRKSIEKARPYYTALNKARAAHFESRRAAMVFEKVTSRLKAAKQGVVAAEKRMMEAGKFDPALQDSMNKATMAVMQSEKLKRKAEEVHSTKTQEFLSADAELVALAKSRKKVLMKTRPYFECKTTHDKNLASMKTEVLKQTANVAAAKKQVKEAMAALERISEEIHQKRAAAKAAQGADGPVSPEKPAQARLKEKLQQADAVLAASDKRQEQDDAAPSLEHLTSSLSLEGVTGATDDEDDSASDIGDEDAEQFLAVNHEHDDEALARSAQEEEAMHIAEVVAEDGGNELSPDVPAEEDHHKVEAAL